MSILNVNKINPVGGGSTVTIAGIASVTNNISVGNSVTASEFHGSGSNLTGVPSVANQADNRLITCTGTTDSLNAESNLTFNSSLVVTDGNGTVTTGGNYVNLKRTSAAVNYINAPLADAELHISADENIVFKTVHTGDFNSTERLRIDSSGRTLIGHTAAHSVGGGNSLLQIQATNSTGRISVVQHRNEAGGSPFISLGKSRGTSNGSTTILQSGDEIGTLTWAGADGNDLDNQACCITGVVDGTPGSNDMPGRLEFRTTADGSASATTRMTITSAGYVTTPATPSFHAVGMSGSSYDNGTMTGSGSGPSHNIGNHYNGSTGIFTAPVAGRYLTGCGVLVENGSGRLEGNISKNNSQTVVNFNGTGTTYDGPSAVAVVQLAANDTLRVKRQSGNAYDPTHGQHYFFAHLIG